MTVDSTAVLADPDVRNRAIRYRAWDEKVTSKQGYFKYKAGSWWSLTLSFALVMDGFYAITISSFYGQRQFQERFGEVLAPGQPKAISAAWQSGLHNGSSVGSIFGLVITSWAADKYGVRPCMLFFFIWLIAMNFISVFAVNLPMLLVGNTLASVGTGSFQTLTTTYASEVVPTVLRPYTTAWVCCAWGIGLTLSAGVIRACLGLNGDWAWRLPFALQWVWPPVLFIVTWFAPESPWNAVRRGRLDQARDALARLISNPTEEDVDDNLAFIQHTTAMEKATTASSTWWQCFKGTNLRRTEINIVTWVIQIFCGNGIVGYAVVFLQAAGFDDDQAFNLNIAIFACQIVGGVLSWWFMAKLGRATLYIGGQAGMFLCLVTIGVLGFVKQTDPVSLAVGILLIVSTLINLTTTGPVCYPIVAETPSGPLRNKTITIGRTGYLIAQILNNILTPRMISATEWNWAAKSGLFFAGTNLLLNIWSWFRLPETKGRTFGEIDLLFEHKVPARKFKYTKVDQFADYEVSRHIEDHPIDADDKVDLQMTEKV
ncbi:hypothetical protein IAT40_005841 [Kwoniella sp. CBS 6097]